MIRSPLPADIHAAELRFAEAKQRTIDGVRRAGLAAQAALARPSSLALIAAAGFCGGWLVSRSRSKPAALRTGDEQAGRGSIAALLLPLALRYAGRILPGVLSRAWAERQGGEHGDQTGVASRQAVPGASSAQARDVPGSDPRKHR
jgi:hypothetical protein